MADRVSASIEIGGALPARLVPELLSAAQADGGCIEWDTPLDENSIIPGETLEVCAHELPWGRFEHLEQFCMDQGLAYRKRAASCGGSFGAEREIYHGQGETVSYEESEAGYVVIGLDAIRALGSLDKIEHWFEAAEAPVPPLILA